MSAFRFRLQPVLDIKTQEKENLQVLYSLAREKLFHRNGDLDNLQQKKYSHLNDLSSETGEAIDPWGRQASWNFINYLGREIEQVTQDIKKLQQRVEEKQQKLVEKYKEEKGLEKLKGNRKKAHYREMERLAQKEVDEMAQQLFLQNRGTGS